MTYFPTRPIPLCFPAHLLPLLFGIVYRGSQVLFSKHLLSYSYQQYCLIHCVCVSAPFIYTLARTQKRTPKNARWKYNMTVDFCIVRPPKIPLELTVIRYSWDLRGWAMKPNIQSISCIYPASELLFSFVGLAVWSVS